MVSNRMFRRGVLPFTLLFAVVLVGGTSGYAQEKGKARITREELRHEIMRFAGRSAERVADAYFKLEEHFQTPKTRRAALENDGAYVSSSLDIAIGPDPEVNLLDMVVFVTLARIVVEEYWVPKVFGDEAKILVEVFRREEADIWSIAGKVLTPQQQKELRFLIKEWRKRNPDQVFVEAARFGDFAGIVGESELAKAQQGGGFLGIKGATREVSEARLLAERAMFYAQRVPWIARSMARLMLFDVAQTPEINQVISDTNTLAKAMHQTAKMTEELPELIAEQRTATIAEVSKMLEQVTGQIEKERTAAINQVLEGVAAERKAIFPQVIEVSDHAFRRAVMLIVIFLVGSLLAGLIYRFVSVRLIGSGHARGA
ncbi:MAG: hypothetical protein ACE5G5_11580 [Candidatus Methylomirabilales bacterium]